MNSVEVLKRLYQERKDWLSSTSHSNEINWVVRGINLCIKHVKDIREEQRIRGEILKPRVSPWISRDLFHTMEVAVRYIKTGDRKKALGVLEKSIAKARAQMEWGAI